MKKPDDEDAIFELAMALEDEALDEYLTTICGDNAALRERVEERLAAKEETLVNLEAATIVSDEMTVLEDEGAGRRIGEGPGTVIGPYTLVETLGQGGMGAVWLAEQEKPVKRQVALKIIKAGMDSAEVIARFEAERQALAMMDHPNIAQVYEAGATEHGRPYFVMERVKGVPITQYCDERRMRPKNRLKLFINVCHGLQHAHQKGVIHRDIKPSNILVSEHDGKPMPKLIDFGIAKATDQQLTDATLMTQLGQMMGTPVYMSPEQASGDVHHIDTRTDVYALGVLLYELLTGSTPISASELRAVGYAEMQRKIVETDPPRPSTRLSNETKDLEKVARQRGLEPATKLGRIIRGDLDWIVMKALEKEPARRYETASGFAADCERYLNSEPVEATPPSTVYRLQKFVRRNRFATAMLLTILIGSGVSIWQSKRANTKAKQATIAEALANERLQYMQINQAERHFESDETELGLAYLSRVVRDNPENAAAAERLLNALVYGNFSILLNENEWSGPLWPDGRPGLMPFDTRLLSTDGQRLLTVSGETAKLWDARTYQPVGEPMRHERSVTDAQFSPDGQRVVTASRDNARLWDANTGLPVGEPMSHEDQVRSAQFSSDGQLVVTASHDKTARLWDARTGQPVGEPMLHGDKVISAQFSPDGQAAVTTSRDGITQLWEVSTGRPLSDPIRSDGSSPNPAQFSPDGQVVMTSSVGGVRLWDANTGQPVGEPMLPTSRIDFSINATHFSPNGQLIVLSSRQETIRLWDTYTCRPVSRLMRHAARVRSAQFRAEGRLETTFEVLENQPRGYRWLWDARPGRLVGESMPHQGIRSAQFSRDGHRLVTASWDTARLWDANTSQSVGEPMRHDGDVHSVEFSPDGQLVVTSDDKAARLWDANTSQPVGEPMHHDATVWDAQFGPHGQLVVTASDDKTARFWDGRTGRPVGEPMRHDKRVGSAKFSSDGQRVVTVETSNAVRLWDGRTGRPVGEPMRHESLPRFSPSGQHVVTIGSDARLWEARTGQPLGEPMSRESSVWDAQFSPDGQLVVTASHDKTARLWDARSGRPVGEPMLHENDVRFAQFSPDGQLVVTLSDQHTARIWDTYTCQLVSELKAQEGRIWSAQFSPGGRRVLTVSSRGIALLWEARTGHPLGDPMRHDEGVSSAQFSPDGQRVVTSSNKSARIWETPRVPLPAPHWLAEWGEAVAGRRLSPMGTMRTEFIPARKILEIRQRILSSSGTDFYTKAAKWFFADRANRTISPWSTTTVAEYVRRRIEEGTTESLRGALSLSPNSGLALAKLAVLTVNQDPNVNSGLSKKALFLAQQAVKWAPTEVDAWRALAKAHLADGQPAEALEAIERTLALQPNSAPAWAMKGVILEVMDRTDEAAQAFRHATELGEDGGRVLNSNLLTQVADSLEKQGKLEQATSVRRQIVTMSHRSINAGLVATNDAKILVPPDSKWKWLHPTDGADPAAQRPDFHQTFFTTGFDDADWATGRDALGPFGGFGYGDESGVDLGTPVENARHTAYFRLRFSTKEDAAATLELQCQRDDGIIVYLDGVEVARDNVEEGLEAYQLPASRTISGDSERKINRYPLALPGTLTAGEHLLAISLHNASSNSSDLRIAGITLVETDPEPAQ